MRNQTETYHSLQFSDFQALENLSRFVGMADVFKGLGGVLAAYVQENFLTAPVEQPTGN
jgi:hypothetical protein